MHVDNYSLEFRYRSSDQAERHYFCPRLWLFFFPFLFNPKKRGKKKRRMNSKNRDHKSCLSARSDQVPKYTYFIAID